MAYFHWAHYIFILIIATVYCIIQPFPLNFMKNEYQKHSISIYLPCTSPTSRDRKDIKIYRFVDIQHLLLIS